MIRQFYIDNFKSLVDFSLPPAPDHVSKFSCIIGLNGAGKSTLLQAFDFIGQLMRGEIQHWLDGRDWKKTDLTSKLYKKQTITFKITLAFPVIGEIRWEGQYNSNLLRCTHESVAVEGTTIFKHMEGQFYYYEQKVPINFSYQGSLLSQLVLKEPDHQPLVELKKFMQNLKSLEMLSPHLMRKTSRKANDVGVGGEMLSSFVATFKGEQKARLLERLQEFYPHVTEWDVKSLKAGWKKLSVHEDYPDSNRRQLETDSRHLNDGTLRILTILAQTQTEHPFLLFDEVENGINPELVRKLVDTLLTIDQQVVVTTHSPMILNYLPDDIAMESVILLYRTKDGRTRCKRYFDIEETKHKLPLMGPGEIFVDTDLYALINELEREAEV